MFDARHALSRCRKLTGPLTQILLTSLLAPAAYASCQPPGGLPMTTASTTSVALKPGRNDAMYYLGKVERGLGREVVRELLSYASPDRNSTSPGDAMTMAVLAAAYSADGADIEARTWAEHASATAVKLTGSAQALVAAVTSTVYFRLGLRDEGLLRVRSAMTQYREAGERTDAAMMALNLARATRSSDERRHALESILADFDVLQGSVHGQRAVAETLRTAAVHFPENSLPAITRLVESTFLESRRNGNRQNLAELHFVRALLAERRGEWSDAMKANDAALALSATGTVALAPDWLWQRGRVLRAQGQADQARVVYADLIQRLEQLKPALDPALLGAGSTFRERYGDAYLEYADLMLLRSRVSVGADRQALLRRVREVMELSKLVEVADYFRDPCIAATLTPRSVESVDARAITLYPIVFDDRLELLVSRQSEISLATVPIRRAELLKTIDEFRLLLEKRATRQHLRPSRRLYDLLIRPIESAVLGDNGSTLVVVPDSILRTIPFAALNDGERYLVEKTTLGTTVSLSLTDPQRIDSSSVRAAVLGLTEARLGFAELPAVREETGRISRVLGTQPQLDAGFTRDRLVANLSGAVPSIVHIASHGQFATDPRESFLLTYDARMDIDTLRQAVSTGAAGGKPLELLMLSACQTAAGDERSAMGLAGVALRSGARSALASLWFVNDDSTAELSSRFYENLIARKLSRAAALRAAQVAMIRDERYAHPAYWAPFLMIGSWL